MFGLNWQECIFPFFIRAGLVYLFRLIDWYIYSSILLLLLYFHNYASIGPGICNYMRRLWGISSKLVARMWPGHQNYKNEKNRASCDFR